MKVTLLAHTQLSEDFLRTDWLEDLEKGIEYTVGQAVALTAIRTCYSSNAPSEIVQLEGEKYFGSSASDGKGGTDADRLMRHIVKSGHTSTLEHITFTFAIEGVSRSLLAQITRHRHFSFSVQSQRYVRFGSDDKSGGFDYVLPKTVQEKGIVAQSLFKASMEAAQQDYDMLRNQGVSAEDARMVLPNAATTNFVLTGNLRSLLDFYSKRSAKGAQWEIRELSELLKKNVIEVEPWIEQFF